MLFPKFTLEEPRFSRFIFGDIALFCASLLFAAVAIQHYKNELPCELCIYVRVWLWAIGLTAVLGALTANWKIPRLAAALLGLMLSVGLAHETWLLIEVEYQLGNGGTCGFFANFPSWAPLDKWWPAMFEVQAFCQATPDVLFGISMAEGLVFVSAASIVCFAFLGFNTLRKIRGE